jgi:energy-converting hydrogenase Eha subunit G
MEGITVRPFVSLIPLLLGGYYLFVSDASSRSKGVVGALLVLSFVLMFAVPTYWLWALLAQIGVGIYIAFYLTFKRQ